MRRRKPPADLERHELAMRLARECRRIVQACLREEEWGDCDREFYGVILAGLALGNGSKPSTKPGNCQEIPSK